MFIMKSNSRSAVPLANYQDLKLLENEGIEAIKMRPYAKAILTRLVNSGYLVEGNY